MQVFDTVPVHKPSANVFNLSHDCKSTYNFDYLYPFLCHPVYPGDTFNCRAEVLLRTMPLLAPVMHNVDLRMWFFFVPNRLIWNENKKRDWKVFITGGEDGLQNPPMPWWNYSKLKEEDLGYLAQDGSLLDHLGFPSITKRSSINNGKIDRISLLPFRAYQLVYNEYFRNQNVQNEIEFSYDAGEVPEGDLIPLFSLRKKCWEKDYFTSALPFQQRGAAVRLPIEYNPGSGSTVSAPVKVTSLRGINSTTTLAYGISVAQSGGSGNNAYASVGVKGSDASNFFPGDAVQLEGSASINTGDITFTGLNVGTINDFRYCMRLQQFLENNARCGSRYIEQLFAHFGVTSSDARLQRPELLGGGKIPLLFTDIEQTSYGTGSSDDVLGDLAGKGTLYGKTSGFKKYFEEHGILLGILSIIPRTSYSQGIPRYWSAMDKLDFYFPEFAHLGEQGILNKEVYYDPASGLSLDPDLAPEAVFGYQGRFTELRYIPSSVHGEMRDELKYWHFGRIFDQAPRLNASFVEANTRADAWALQDVAESGYDPFVAQIHLDIKAVRPLPKYAVPTL